MRLLLVDLSGLFYPAYRATPDAQDFGSVLSGTLSRITSLAARYEGTAICCDSPPYTRREAHPSYKANREADAVARNLLRTLQDRLTATGYPIWSSPGAEADDVIASAAKALGTEHEVVIATSDKDLLACVRDRDREAGDDGGGLVAVYRTLKDEVWHEAEVVAKLGVRPAQVADYLALVGDTSDNVPGVRGVGPKGAAQLLAQFGDLDTLIKRIGEVKSDKIRAAIQEAHDSMALTISRYLVALNTGIKLDWTAITVPRVAAQTTTEDSMTDDPEQLDIPISAPPTVAPQPPVPDVPPSAPTPEAPRPAQATARASSGELVRVDILPPSDERYAVALEPRSYEQAKQMAAAVYDSRLFAAIPNPQTAWLVITAGRSMGLDAMTALQGHHLIKGKITWHAGVIVGRVIASGKADFFKLIESTADRATWKTHRRDDPDSTPTTHTYSLDDARRAGLVTAGSQWEKRPATMCRHRASVELARIVYPDVVWNTYTPDELDDNAEVPE